MPSFFDTHAHLNDERFASDLGDVMQRASVAGIERIVCIGTDVESSRAVLDLCERWPNVFAAVGWHPSYVLEAPNDVRPALRALAAHPKVTAIGETGLDYYRLPSKQGGTAADDQHYKSRQAELFGQQLELAAELGLNCVIHQRDSLADTLAQLRPFAGRVRSVFHCFSSEPALMRQVVEFNGLVSFTGLVTFKNSAQVRETIKAVPADRFMLETDSPYMAPVPYRGRRCEPAFVKEIAECVAEVRGCSVEELSRTTCQTARDFFKGL